MKKTARLLGAVFCVLILLEAALRWAGLVDVPFYCLTSGVNYLPQPLQRGMFGRRHDWAFNDKSMPVATAWNPGRHPAVLLIGNSIVMGGNVFAQKDKLTAQMQRRMDQRITVWPLAAGGWTTINEAAYLDQHPEIIAQADQFAWEYMQGGLAAATAWPGELAFPTHKPLFAIVYVLRRYVAPHLWAQQPVNELPVTGAATAAGQKLFDRQLGFLRQAPARPSGLIWLYPKAAQLAAARKGQEWLPERQIITALAEKYHLQIIDLAQDPRWNLSLYRDDQVHPTVEGNRVLADILTQALAAAALTGQ